MWHNGHRKPRSDQNNAMLKLIKWFAKKENKQLLFVDGPLVSSNPVSIQKEMQP